MENKTVVVVGAGLSGICMGIALKRLGLDFVILEKTNDIGGTWSQNRYPGCGCDIPMFAYCYSFEQFQGEAWPKQPEILAYFRHCVEKYELKQYIRLNTSVLSSSFEPGANHWRVKLDDEAELCAKFLINATGQLNNPSIPVLEGADKFEGVMVHSANYPENLDVKGKRVAVVGNGASALQIVEALQSSVKSLICVARSGKYVFPRIEYSPISVNRMKSDGEFWRNAREQFTESQEEYRRLLDDFPQFDPFDSASQFPTFYARAGLRNLEEHSVFYEWLSQKGFRPAYPTGCSRPLVSNTFHNAIRAQNVTLVRENSPKLHPTHLQAGGAKYPVDVVILATGFSLNNLIPPYSLYGASGQSLSDAWRDIPSSYMGMFVAGFPNFFMLYGPNTNTNASSVTFFVEKQVELIEKVLRRHPLDLISSIDVKADIQSAYMQQLRQRAAGASEASACSSWYKNADGINVSTFPGGFREYAKLLEGFNEADFHLVLEGATKVNPVVADCSHVLPGLQSLLSAVTLLPLDQVESRKPLREFALDSILIVDFVKRINERWNIAMESSRYFEFDSLMDIATFIAQSLVPPIDNGFDGRSKPFAGQIVDAKPELPRLSKKVIDEWRSAAAGDEQALDVAQVSPFDERSALEREPVAIIAAHGYFPQAKDIETLWQNLASGLDCISVVPSDRWDWRAVDGSPADGNKSSSKWGGFIENVGHFDPLFFKMSPREAELMDPQHRLFLQCSFELFERAGYNPAALAGRRIGVVVGVNLHDYADIVAQSLEQHDVLEMSGLMHLFSPNRLSYQLGLTGPSEVIDTACSSSLVAIHRAIQAIRMDNCEMMLVGGVNLMLTPKMHILYSKAGMLSNDGRCKTFADNANGYVRGEGVAAVLLKRLSLAQRDGDQILAVIKGSSENHGGRSTSLTAPNARLQAQLITDALDESGVDPRSIGYIECHGTGTPLGDPIEINGIKSAFKAAYQRRGLPESESPHCGLGSIKSNIGHLETAAGIAGVIKVLQCFKHKVLPKSLHAEKINPQIQLSGTPFYLCTETSKWPTIEIDGVKQPRRAGISSFGAGGANAHLLLEEYVEPEQYALENRQGKDYLIPLSARTPEQLTRIASELTTFLAKNDHSLDLSSLAYTLQLGRESMQERAIFVVSSLDDFRTSLLQWLDGAGKSALENAYFSASSRHQSAARLFELDDDLKAAVDRWYESSKLQKLAELWASGVSLDWQRFWNEKTPKRIVLPTYPFDLKRYWISTERKPLASLSVGINRVDGAPWLHPFVHRNTSTFTQQSYSSTFDGNAFYLDDHRVGARKILPAAACIEMVRAAINLATDGDESLAIMINSAVWMAPIVVEQQRQVELVFDSVDNGTMAFRILNAETGTLYCRGQVEIQTKSDSVILDLAAVRNRMRSEQVNKETIYSAFSSSGLNYGTAHQALDSFVSGEDELLARVVLPDSLIETQRHFVLHPSLLDAVLQACNGLRADFHANATTAFLPFSLDNITVFEPIPTSSYAWVRRAALNREDKQSLVVDIDVLDESGKLCVQLRGFLSRRVATDMTANSADATDNGIFISEPVWTDSVAPVSSLPSAQQRILLINSVGAEQGAVESALRKSGVSTHIEVLQTGENIAECYQSVALRCAEMVQKELGAKQASSQLIQLVVSSSGQSFGHALFGLIGMLNSINLERPDLTWQIVEVELRSAAKDLAQQLREAAATRCVAVRFVDGQCQQLSWLPYASDLSLINTNQAVWREKGVYVIAGGAGGIGLLLAKELLQKVKSGRVILFGRSTLSEATNAKLDAINSDSRQHGNGAVHHMIVDVTSFADTTKGVAEVIKQFGRIDGVFHCAGVLQDGLLARKTTEQFKHVLAPKLHGTMHLDQATAMLDLDFFVLFSSVAATLGNTGQSDYAAANGFLDQFSLWRNAQVSSGIRSGRTLSINWPLWQSGGIRVSDAGLQMLERAFGMKAIATESALNVLHQGLLSNRTNLMVIAGNIDKIRATIAERSRLPAPVVATEKQEHSVSVESENAATAFQGYLKKVFSSELRLQANQIGLDDALDRFGIDSILAMNLTQELEKTFGTLPKTLFFEFRTISELAAYFSKKFPDHSFSKPPSQPLPTLRDELKAVLSSNAAEEKISPAMAAVPTKKLPILLSKRSAQNKQESTEEIAIVGVSGRYPLSPDLEAFWNNLSEGVDCITEVPAARWAWRDYYSTDRTIAGAHFSKWGGFIDGVDEFDPRFFSISPREAEILDPQERLFLQQSWMAIEDAGYSRERLQISHADDLPAQVGVYVGVMYSEYQLFGAEQSLTGDKQAFASSTASIANRVSYVLNVHGPSITLDTMCSASITAIHLACQDLRLGRTDMALAGGVNVSVHPNKYLMLSAGQFISSAGQCQSFGVGGDGYIPGEGVGVVVLKRLKDAERDGNHVYGIVMGSALNHGGKTNGFTVPNVQAQAKLIQRALKESNVEPWQISYVEAHGTGTKLGDPIEIAALNRVFESAISVRGKQFCQIGSSKSNIGHCESAAGIAGLSKILLQLQHGKIAPSLHSRTLNPYIDFENSAFIVNQELRNWERPLVAGNELPRIAAISSFGAGGSNAHMVVKEYMPPMQRQRDFDADSSDPVLIPVSARTAEQLEQKVRDLLRFVERNISMLSLRSLAYTLQVGRDAMDERLALVVNDKLQLIEKLKSLSHKLETTNDVYIGQPKTQQGGIEALSQDDDMLLTVERWMQRKKLDKLAEFWVKGLKFDWGKLYGESKPTLMSLPTYPFAKDKIWFRKKNGVENRVRTGELPLGSVALENVSNAYQYLFRAKLGEASTAIHEPGGESQQFSSILFSLACRVVREFLVSGLADNAVQIDSHVVSPALAWPLNGQLDIALLPVDEGGIFYEIFSKQSDGSETVFAQGKARLVQAKTERKLDLAPYRSAMASVLKSADRAGLHVGKSELLLKLDDVAESGVRFEQHDILVRIAKAVGEQLLEQVIRSPINVGGIAKSTLYFNRATSSFALVRGISDSAFDVIVFSEDGRVCSELQGAEFGLSLDVTPVRSDDVAVSPLPFSSPLKSEVSSFSDARAAQELAIGLSEPVFGNGSSSKPSNIALLDLNTSFDNSEINPEKPGAVALLALQRSVESIPHLPVFDHGAGVYSVKLDTLISPAIYDALANTLNAVSLLPDAKVVMMHLDAPDHEPQRQTIVLPQHLLDTVAKFPLPLLFVTQYGATAVAWSLALLSDHIIGAAEGEYGFANGSASVDGFDIEHQLLVRHMDRFAAQSAWLLPGQQKGLAWLSLGLRATLIASEQVLNEAIRCAKSLAGKPKEALVLLRSNLSKSSMMRENAFRPTAAPEKLPQAKVDVGNEEFSALHLVEESGQLLHIRIRTAQNSPTDILRQLTSQLKKSAFDAGYNAILISSAEQSFFLFDEKCVDRALQEDLLSVLQDSPIAIGVALESGASDFAWLFALASDLPLCSVENRHGFNREFIERFTFSDIHRLLSKNYSSRTIVDLLCAEEMLAGEQLSSILRGKCVEKSSDVLHKCANLLQTSSHRLTRLKQLAKQLQNAESETNSIPTLLRNSHSEPLSVDVVAISVDSFGVGVISMQDRKDKNIFTEGMVEALFNAFSTLENDPTCRVIVLTGFDQYFSAGGDRATLLSIYDGSAKFTDRKAFELPLHSSRPVISAIQGHAIGAGLVLGLNADFAVLAAESHFSSPYMEFGFTPGAGATRVLPEQMGYSLAARTLMTAESFTGDQLARMGLPLQVVSRNNVLDKALSLARSLTKFPVSTLQEFKRSTAQKKLARLAQTYDVELYMHARTFVGNQRVWERIEEKYHGVDAPGKTPSTSLGQHRDDIKKSGRTIATASVNSAVSSTVAVMLANELGLAAEEIVAEKRFVDMGLDSVVAVTLIRKINEQLALQLDATIVYSYPTLFDLARHIESVREVPVVAEKTSPVPAYNNEAVATSTIQKQTSRVHHVMATLSELLALELGLQKNEIEPLNKFIDLGLDSVSGVSWMRKINEHFDLKLEATTIYSYPTLDELCRFIEAELGPRENDPAMAGVVAFHADTQSSATISQEPRRFSTTSQRLLPSLRKTLPAAKAMSVTRSGAKAVVAGLEPVAVIGMAGRFPMAADLDEFWSNIAAAKNCISEIPANRWDADAFYQKSMPLQPGKTNSKWMGALADVDCFDPLFFNISPIEAESMDPQQRLFLQTCWHGIENAGYDANALSGSKCGVFVGCGTGDYQQFSEEQLSAQGFTGSSSSILAARTSYFLNLQGPCLAIETACSSSLVAIATACDSLACGSSDLALAGGVYVMSGPAMHIKTAQSGMLSNDGRCYTFDQRANGFVPGEAVGVLLLKRLSDAERDGDIIHGVIKAWGVNQDGKTNGITAPNALAQARLLKDTYQKFGIDANSIQFVEAHGTGTKLGDPIEIQGLKNAFPAQIDGDSPRCALGSVKSNIGHCVTAAGVASAIKVLLSLKNRQIPPTVNFNTLNEHISLAGSPFYINAELRPWHTHRDMQRIGAASSFGFSGTNAHIVIAEYELKENVTQTKTQQPLIAMLSAKTKAQLKEKAADLKRFIARNKAATNLQDVVFTLHHGRTPFIERFGAVVSSLEDLNDALEAFLSDQRSDSYFCGSAGRDSSMARLIEKDPGFKATLINQWKNSSSFDSLADAWTNGFELSWDDIYDGLPARKISLPGYPFARERYWKHDASSITALNGVSTSTPLNPALHPLLQTNLSNLLRQRYRVVFTGSEPFLNDHRVNQQPVLPGVVYLEMARAAASYSLQASGDCSWQFKDVVWLKPLVVNSPVAVEVDIHEIEDQTSDFIGLSFEISSMGKDGSVLHCQGQLHIDDIAATKPIDLTAIRLRSESFAIDKDIIYESLNALGLQYGNSQQGLLSIESNRDTVVAAIQRPANGVADWPDFLINPCTVDSALQSIFTLAFPDGPQTGQAPLPFSIDSMVVNRACPERVVVVGRKSGTADHVLRFDIDIADESGNVCVVIKGLSMRLLSSETRTLSSTQVTEVMVNEKSFDEAFYQNLVDKVLHKEVSVAEAVELG